MATATLWNQPSSQTRCGVPATHPVRSNKARIINGVDSLPGSCPWHVAVMNTDGDLVCSGALISPVWVISAAHCNITNDHLIGIGIAARHSKNNQANRIAQVFNHPDYHSGRVAKDIALVKMATPVRFSKNVSTVCLPQTGEVFPAQSLCLTSGWGFASYNATDIPHKLQQSYMTLMPNDQCKKYWGTTVPRNIICAGSLGVTISKGDSGNPLVCLSNNTWTLVGLMSKVSEVNSSYKPFFSPRITFLLPWIKKIVLRN
ncbi:chymotrypsinogen B-like [Talpa occidentalis]|uniref:chymotrypsinogen B-like n=1 Tax=Talpa occidentalis TaxID=50954 RepID=UPI00188FAFB5|nr:chymotrypsinogen B-like [Talpa occidentalis]